MSVEAGESPPNLNLSPDEKRVFGQLFRQADTENVGVVTGEVAVKFFDKTRLDSRILGEIWQIADKENRGFLTPAGFGIVLRLIGHAQAGREPTPELALQTGPLPRFDGLSALLGTVASTPVSPLQAQGTGGGPIRIPPLTSEKVAQYSGLFERQNLSSGNVMPGDQAKQIFEKSGLPNELLGRIWQLSDTEQRGGLVLTEFVIAMHLLTSLKTGALRGLPNVLPAALYEAATRRGSASRQSPTTTAPISAIPRQLSGTTPLRGASPFGRPPMSSQPTGLGMEWLVTATDKARFDQIYETLDKTRKGFITGEEAVPFFGQSNLGEDTLAQIWDLSDINSVGHLTRDEFAVAMYLIRQQRSNRDGTNTLPSTLPPNLVPPSMRHQVRPPTAGSAFDIPPAQPPPTKSALDDLFGLDASSAPPPPLQAPLPTGGSVGSDPFATGTAGMAPASPLRPSSTGMQFKPFVPSSTFGRGLAQHGTGESGSQPRPAATEDLLGDNDPEISSKLTNETAELANLSNQVGSLSKKMQQVQAQRSSTQNDLNQASAQKKNFEQRLSQLRSMYEKEAKDVRSLEEQLTAARNETKKLQTECMLLEGSYRDLQNQHGLVLSGLRADQQENANLKEKIRAVNAEVSQMKSQIEKMRSEARQQKGLVAINKKQLATNEGEREKLKTEADDLTKSIEESSRQISSASPTPVSAQIASPAPSTASGNNPFFKRTMSTDIMGAFASPTIKPFSDKSFDDVFGPSFPPTQAASTPPPASSFNQQDTGTSTASAGSFATPAASTPNVSPPMSRVGDDGAIGNQPPPSAPFPFAPAATEAIASDSLAPAEGALPESDLAEVPTDTTPKPMPGSSSALVHPDPFGTSDQEKAKADFENAFASFTKAHNNKSPDKPPTEADTAFSNFNTEFPPIAELDRDEDSETASEQGGFDDDFAPSPPNRKSRDKVEIGGKPEIGSGTGGSLDAFPPVTLGNVVVDEQVPDARGNTPPPFPASQVVEKADDDIFGPGPSPAPADVPATHSQSATVDSKAPFDDLDDEFEGLEEAKEGSGDDDFATISRSGLDDFNPVFDSSPPPSQAKSDSAPFGAESSYDFGTISTSSVADSGLPIPSQVPVPATKPTDPNSPDPHDWDAIFASLDSADTAASTPTKPQQTPARPDAPGRALTQEGEHDDPILKNLTSMGYSRADAVLALEKYDYNLERAANYLASQS